MKCYVGIDLGSTTTKAVILDEAGELLGRGITNSRSNYDVACKVAEGEAETNARFALLRRAIEAEEVLADRASAFLDRLERQFRRQQHLRQLESLEFEAGRAITEQRYGALRAEVRGRSEEIFGRMQDEADRMFTFSSPKRSDFFRDLAGSQYLRHAEQLADPAGVTFDHLLGVFDRAIVEVENARLELDYDSNIGPALDGALEGFVHDDPELAAGLRRTLGRVANSGLETGAKVGTGYGRARLPFPREWIRSEILCHGLGAHQLFPATATVLDIGGQDTKAIQVDGEGLVTSFQMNDRCAAGCGRYLGYIADELNLGLHELGPLAEQSKRRVKISSTCTVFAGAELRERLANGERREDILAGLHRAIVLRAMSLLARSGGIRDEFTFTGGVAKNPAAVGALSTLVSENYGDVEINISPDSIYTGALGAALFAWRESVVDEDAT